MLCRPSYAELSIDLTVASEYDDNVNLASTVGQEGTSDFVFRVSPTVAFRLPWEDHRLLLDVNGDYRRGLRTSSSDLNLSATAGIDLDFPGGFEFSLVNTYTRTRFDQALRAEAGTPDNDTNRLQVTGSYTLVERLRAEARYSHETQDFDLNSTTSAVKREIDSIEGNVSIPVTRSAVGYVSYSLESQDSPDRPRRAYQDEGYRAGIRWQGPSRFDLRFEVGQQELDFDLAEQEDFTATVGEMGAAIQLTEFAAVDIAVGRDGFGELTYDGSLSYRNDRDFSASLAFGRQTAPSFSFVFSDNVLQSTYLDVMLSNRLANRFTVSLDGRYQLQESALSAEDRNDRLLSATLRMEYPIQDWLQLEARYQFSRRTSSRETFAFKNNRVGVYVAFSFQGGD